MRVKWTSLLALLVAMTMIATPAFAQQAPKSGEGVKTDAETPKAQKDATKAESAAKGVSPDKVKEAQQSLKDKGFDPGPADGILGPKTREAVEEFQKAEALEPSGTLTDETLAKLGVDRSPAASPATQPGPTEPGKAKSPAR